MAGRVEFVGNRTECALIMLLRNWGQNESELRQQHEEELFKVRPKH